MFHFSTPLEKLEKKRLKALYNPRLPEKFRSIYQTPLPTDNTPLDECRIFSIDFETTGLDFQHDTVLSIGGLNISKGRIEFDSSFHRLLKPNRSIKGSTAVINMITPEQLINGDDPEEAMNWLFQKLSGGVVITHCKTIEYNFMLKILKLEQFDLPLVFLDTMAIEHHLMSSSRSLRQDFTLAGIRNRRGFPPYEAHNALADSLATAELFLAQVKDIFGKVRPTLGALVKRSQ
ncbi:MAG: hypothetical protein J6M93_04135 [Succinivibrio sp.]|nr:hypothetical protein [Succinivibrio sp.]